MKKIFALVMSVLMITCFMPTMAFASGGGSGESTKVTFGEGQSAVDVGVIGCGNENCDHVVAVKIGNTTVHYSSPSVAFFDAWDLRGMEGNSTKYGESPFKGDIEENANSKKSEVKLLKDIEATFWRADDGESLVMINAVQNEWDVTLDMNGHNLTLGKQSAFQVDNGTLTIKNSQKTGGNIKEKEPWMGPIQVFGAGTDKESYEIKPYTKLVVESGVTLEGYCGIRVQSDSGTYKGYGVDITIKGKLIGHADSTDSTDTGAGIEVKGELNKTTGNVPKITLDGATLQADGTGIYAAGYADWTLTDTSVEGNTPSAMCIKSGKFTIKSGEYYSSGEYDTKTSLEREDGSVDTGAAINIINQDDYAGNIDVTIEDGLFSANDGYAIYQGTVGKAESDAELTIEDGEFVGPDGALELTNIKNKKVVKKGIFSSDPRDYVTDDAKKNVINANNKWYVGSTQEDILTDRNKSALDQGVELAPLTDASKSVEEEDLASEYTMNYSDQNVTINVKPQLHTMESGGQGKWIGIAVPVGKVETSGAGSEANTMSYKFSNGASVDDATITEKGIGKYKGVIVKKITLNEESYVGFYWDYDKVKVDWIKYKFDGTEQDKQVFIDVNAMPVNVGTVVNHKAGKDACVCGVTYENGVATVEYCGLSENEKAAVKIPVEYKAADEETTYLYYKYNDATAWTMMEKPELDPEDGLYYEYCWIDLKDGNKVKLQYKYGDVKAVGESGTWISPVQTGVYTLTVKAKKVAGDANDGEQKHSYTEKVTTEPTTAAAGVKTYTCERCGASYTKTIVKLADMTKLTVTQPSASVETGSIAKAEGYSETLEYKLSSSNTWTDLDSEIENLSPGTYYVRLKAENDQINGDYYETVVIKKYTASSGGGGGYVAPTTDNVTNKTEDKTETTTATVKPATTTVSGVTTTTAAVSDATGTQIVEKAVSNKSSEVVINAATGTAVKEAAAGTATEISIPAATVSQIVEKTDAAVIIKSDVASVTLDKEAVEAVAAAAGTSGTVKLIVETVAQDENIVKVELKIETANGTVSDFKGGIVSVTVKLSAALAAKDVVSVYIDDNGVYHKVAGQKNADGTYTFTTGHFSSYAVMPADDADKVLAQQEAEARELAKALKLTARSAKTAKGNIKVTLTVNADEIKAIEDLGYTVKYKFYRSTKKASSYKAALEKAGKTYTNTSGKKGTKYYYKARVMVYDAEGTLVAKSELKQCKYACRIK